MTVHSGNVYVVGVDPGPTPGIVRLVLSGPTVERVDVTQCTATLLVPMLNALIESVPFSVRTALTYEAFVVGPRAARSSYAGRDAGRVTRDMVRDLETWAEHRAVTAHTYRAADVKPWATDARLQAAGLLVPTRGMCHARDAARHALYTAVRHCGLPDPLSRRGDAA